MQAHAIKAPHLAASTKRTKFDRPAAPQSLSTAKPWGSMTAVLYQRQRATVGASGQVLERSAQTSAKQLSWRKSGPLTAKGQAPVLPATHLPRKFIERLSVMSSICFAWALTAGAKNAMSPTSFEGDGHASGSGSMLLVFFGLLDAALTRIAEDKALNQYQQQQEMLLALHLVLDKLKTVLRRHPNDGLAQAARDVVLFNITTLNRLLDAHENEREPKQHLDGLRQLRHFRADLYVLAHKTQRLRQRLNKRGHDRQLQARYLRRHEQFDDLSKEVAKLEAELRQSPLDWAKRLWNEGFDSLTLPGIVLARDFGIPVGTAVPVLTAAASTISAEALAHLAQETAHILETVSAAIGTCLQPVNLANGVMDLAGGQGLHHKARGSKNNAGELLAHLQRVYNFYLNEPDPLKRAVCLEAIFQRMKTLQEALEHAHRVGRVGQARRLKGLLTLFLALLNTVSGSQSAAHKGALAISAPGNALAGSASLLFLGLLSSTIFANFLKERRARKRERKALKAVAAHGLSQFPQGLLSQADGSDGRPRQDHPRLDSSHLLKEWLSAQLMLLSKDVTQPLSGVEELLFNMALPKNRDLVVDTLRYLRCVSLLASPADFRLIVRAVVNELMGEQGLVPASVVNKSLPNMQLPDEELMSVSQAPADAGGAWLGGSSFHLLEQASKQAGRDRLKGAKGTWPDWLRWLRGLGRNSLATSTRTLKHFRRVEKRDHQRAPSNHQGVDRLSRRILQSLLEKLPRKEDGHSIAWPDGLEGDTGECLDALLAQMVKDCNRAAAALEGVAKLRRDTRALARRLQAQARVIGYLRQHIKHHQQQGGLFWWDWQPPPAAIAAAAAA